MKKILAIFSCMFLFLSVTGCNASKQDGGIMETSASEVLKKLQRDDNSFLLFLTTDKCYSCDEYMKMLEKIQEEQVFDIYYVVIDDEDEDKLEELKIITGDYTDLPMTYYFNKGELSADNIKKSYIEPDQFKEWMNQLGIMK